MKHDSTLVWEYSADFLNFFLFVNRRLGASKRVCRLCMPPSFVVNAGKLTANEFVK